jgi:hypothetical protein
MPVTAVRSLALSAGLLAAAVVAPLPAHADPVTDQFLGALTNAGVGYTDPGAAAALGQSVCPMLAQPGGNVAGVASRMAGTGIPPNMAALFTSIAISMYCPSMLASFAGGNFMNGMPPGFMNGLPPGILPMG